MKRFAALALLLSLCTPAAFAWGEKGHYITNETATLGLPTDMPHFFLRAFPELVFLAYDPDRWRGAGESLDAVNLPDHFLDYEYVMSLQLPPDRYAYVALLESSGTLRRHGITNSTPGFLPWRIAELSERLQNEFRQWRLAAPRSRERDFIERDIIHTAGVLGHFAGDSANPDHATTNFNGWLDPNPNHYPNDCDAHVRFETNFISHALDTADAVPYLAAPKLRTDYFAAALEAVRDSNAHVEQLYTLDRDGGFDVLKPVSPVAKEFAARRLATGASLLRDLWWSAWTRSASRPAKKVVAPE